MSRIYFHSFFHNEIDKYSLTKPTKQNETTIEKGDYLYKEGTNPNKVYFLEKGRACVVKNNGQSNVLVAFCNPGMALGLYGSLMNAPMIFSVKALERINVLEFDADQIRKTIRKLSLKQAEQSIINLIKDIELITDQLIDGSHKDAIVRVSAMLIKMAESYTSSESNTIKIKLTISELAEMANVRRETMQRIKRSLEQYGLVKIKGDCIHFSDVDRLRGLRKYGETWLVSFDSRTKSKGDTSDS